MLLFDIETNGLLDTLDTIHCVGIHNTATGESFVANDHGASVSVEEALKMLMAADSICGHNIIAFDIPAIQKVHKWFAPAGQVRDTLIMSRLIYANMAEVDFKLRKKNPKLTTKMIGSHSLEAWGIRLGEWKGDYAEVMEAKGLDPWAEWNQEMDDYCGQDVVVTRLLYEKLISKGFSEESIQLEHDVAPIILRQEKHGFLFNSAAAWKLAETLQKRRVILESELRAAFPPWMRGRGVHTPKRSMRRKVVTEFGEWREQVTEGAPFTRIEQVIFNPGSRDHIADRLIAKYGWKPRQFTDEGKPKVDETVLEALPYPEAKLLTEYLLVEKRIGQVADGREAWVKAIGKDGRIHGLVNQNGAVTGRMTHSKPNMAQVPKVDSPYGEECRSLFCVPAGRMLVGADASGLELRCLAHYMARWDGGEYAKVILEGDIHSVNQQAAGLPTRDNAKTFIYAFLYGAGDAKIGTIVGRGAKAGKALKDRFLKGIPALGNLLSAVKKRAKSSGYLTGLDGRKLYIRSDHAALNTLLQGAGAIVMKKALVILDGDLQERGFVPGHHYEFVANVHDEWQIECDAPLAEEIGKAAVGAIRKAGEHFGFRCPLDGEFKIGRNWAETH